MGTLTNQYMTAALRQSHCTLYQDHDHLHLHRLFATRSATLALRRIWLRLRVLRDYRILIISDHFFDFFQQPNTPTLAVHVQRYRATLSSPLRPSLSDLPLRQKVLLLGVL